MWSRRPSPLRSSLYNAKYLYPYRCQVSSWKQHVISGTTYHPVVVVVVPPAVSFSGMIREWGPIVFD